MSAGGAKKTDFSHRPLFKQTTYFSFLDFFLGKDPSLTELTGVFFFFIRSRELERRRRDDD